MVAFFIGDCTVVPAKNPKQNVTKQICAPRHRGMAAGNVRYRTYDPDKKADTDQSVYSMTVCITSLRAIRNLICRIYVAVCHRDCRVEKSFRMESYWKGKQ